MNAVEARIAAHVCGDGWLSKWLEKNSLQIVNGRRYYRDRIRYEIGYCNTDPTLLDQFANDVAKVFDIKPNRRKIEVRFRSKRVFDRIESLGAGGSYDWKVGKEILNGSILVKKNWIKAFFDDEATIDKKSKRIRVKIMNHRGLKYIKNMLINFGIKSSITGPNIDKSWFLTISKIESIKYVSKIGFNHTKKKDLSKNIIIKRN